MNAPSLNESPSKKEGKYHSGSFSASAPARPSMKVPPKRKGNDAVGFDGGVDAGPSMKVPPKRKGNAVGSEDSSGSVDPQ